MNKKIIISALIALLVMGNGAPVLGMSPKGSSRSELCNLVQGPAVEKEMALRFEKKSILALWNYFDSIFGGDSTRMLVGLEFAMIKDPQMAELVIQTVKAKRKLSDEQRAQLSNCLKEFDECCSDETQAKAVLLKYEVNQKRQNQRQAPQQQMQQQAAQAAASQQAQVGAQYTNNDPELEITRRFNEVDEKILKPFFGYREKSLQDFVNYFAREFADLVVLNEHSRDCNAAMLLLALDWVALVYPKDIFSLLQAIKKKSLTEEQKNKLYQSVGELSDCKSAEYAQFAVQAAAAEAVQVQPSAGKNKKKAKTPEQRKAQAQRNQDRRAQEVAEEQAAIQGQQRFERKAAEEAKHAAELAEREKQEERTTKSIFIDMASELVREYASDDIADAVQHSNAKRNALHGLKANVAQCRNEQEQKAQAHAFNSKNRMRRAIKNMRQRVLDSKETIALQAKADAFRIVSDAQLKRNAFSQLKHYVQAVKAREQQLHVLEEQFNQQNNQALVGRYFAGWQDRHMSKQVIGVTNVLIDQVKQEHDTYLQTEDHECRLYDQELEYEYGFQATAAREKVPGFVLKIKRKLHQKLFDKWRKALKIKLNKRLQALPAQQQAQPVDVPVQQRQFARPAPAQQQNDMQKCPSCHNWPAFNGGVCWNCIVDEEEARANSVPPVLRNLLYSR